MLTSQEQERYSRQIRIDEIGQQGQERLKAARVLVAGAGGLGSPVSIYLAAAGVGNISIVDNDTVALSNLNRQVLHRDADIGRAKADSARDTLGSVNPGVRIAAIMRTITADNVGRLVDGQDLVVDAMDNQAARHLLNRAAVDRNIPLIHGAVCGFEGRAMTVLPGRSACLCCMHARAAAPAAVPVIGAVPAVIGAIQTTEAIKCILGVGERLAGRLLIYDGLAMTFTEFRIKRRPGCDHCGHR